MCMRWCNESNSKCDVEHSMWVFTGVPALPLPVWLDRVNCAEEMPQNWEHFLATPWGDTTLGALGISGTPGQTSCNPTTSSYPRPSPSSGPSAAWVNVPASRGNAAQ
ncbi:hypothetical protein AALO_G00018050 [Alosa alosa]|uniref:Uncharacterized protein n=1 Tax=Alosa alosa TaxID=278164 RepID=A0AAV6HLD6_9TELE|nr:hypothetical protein AALO_G00018050 [Alosa alosa]